MVRKPALEVIDCLKHLDLDHTAPRFLLCILAMDIVDKPVLSQRHLSLMEKSCLLPPPPPTPKRKREKRRRRNQKDPAVKELSVFITLYGRWDQTWHVGWDALSQKVIVQLQRALTVQTL